MSYNRIFNNKGWKQYYSDDKIDYSETLDYSPTKYILNEFFNSSHSTLQKFLNKYESKFGLSSVRYFSECIPEWKNRTKEMTSGMRNRIISLMPQFFDKPQKFHLIKFSVYNQVNSLGKSLENRSVNEENVLTEYLNVINEIYQIDPKIILTPILANLLINEDEKNTVVRIIKHIIVEQLIGSFKNVRDDLFILKEELSKIELGVKKVEYKIDLLKCKIEITRNRFDISNSIVNKIVLDELTLFKNEVNYFLTSETFKLDLNQKKNEVNGTISKKDINILVNNHSRLNNDKIIYSSNSEFRGKGGSVTINLETKNQTTMLFNLTKKYFLMIVALGGFIFPIILFSEGSPILAIGAGFFLLLWVIGLFESIKESKKEIKDYGKW